ncbi:MAG TPA: flagellar hook assembly protein FlgD [Rhodocyclaceae bacterium]|nr:flagellar hook assembly protein FlgD [Rhodocyclaceae bacterium]
MSGTGTRAAGAADDSQTRFLRLLTTQLKNQDPLNPMDNAQMTSQLAQISTVSGIQQLNATLQNLIDDSASSQAMQAAAMVGRNVLVPGGSLQLSASGQAVGGIDLSGAADNATVTIKDGNGLVVRTLALGALGTGSRMFVWDGKADSGDAAVPGNYSFSVAATQGANKINTTALAVGQVSSITRSGAGLALNVGGLGAFGISDVRQIL